MRGRKRERGGIGIEDGESLKRKDQIGGAGQSNRREKGERVFVWGKEEGIMKEQGEKGMR